MKIAIVYDWLDKWGGVERILLTLHEIFPQADFYTSYFDEKEAFWARDLNIKTSFIQQIPSFIKKSRTTSLLFYPFAFESFNFNNYDLVISATSSFAKAIITQPKTFHFCYLLTPTRFLWSHESDYLSTAKKKLIRSYLNYLKNWDKTVAQRPDRIVSISQTVADRCRRYYGRESEVIYPPFDIEYWNMIRSKVKSQNSKLQLKSQKFFLVVSRLEPYKKVDLAIDTFNKMSNLSLVIVGKGSQEKKLRKLAGNNILFLNNLNDEELAYLYSKARALIMPQEEDFGYVALEAQFFGCPVIAYKKGGATETIKDGETGLFFNRQSVESLKRTVERFNKIGYNLRYKTSKFGDNVERFNKTKFMEKFKNIISIKKL